MFVTRTWFSVLYRPHAAFKSLSDVRHWAAPLGVLTVLSFLASLLQLPAIVRDSMNKMQHAVAIGQLSPIQYDESMQASITIFSTLGGSILAIPLQVFIGALLLLLVNQLVRGAATYADTVNVAMAASIPGITWSLIVGIVSLLMKADSLMNVPLNASVFVEQKTSFVGVVLSQIHPFSIWSICLIIVGLSIMCKKPWSLIAAWVVGGYIGLITVSAWMFG